MTILVLKSKPACRIGLIPNDERSLPVATLASLSILVQTGLMRDYTPVQAKTKDWRFGSIRMSR